MRDILTDLSDMMSDPDPVRRAQIQMHKPLPKRFYTDADIAEEAAGFVITLDGKPVRTPARHALAFPTQALGEAAVAEWRAQDKVIDPVTMPLTRLAHTAIDGVADTMDAVGEDVVRYAGTDMVCYRAATPEELVARQAAAWDPIIAFAADDLGARFVLAEGVMHVTQPPQALAAFQAEIAKVREPFALTALHMATTLTGSALIAMAMARGVISVEEAWAKAHLEEDWTAELWGEDLEATHRRKARFVDMKVAAMVLRARSF